MMATTRALSRSMNELLHIAEKKDQLSREEVMQIINAGLPAGLPTSPIKGKKRGSTPREPPEKPELLP